MDGYTILGALLIFFGIFIYITWFGFSIKVESDKANKSEIKIHLNLISQALGILQDDSYKKISEELESKIQTLILKRTEAKDNKDYDLADKIRNELLDLGVEIKDTSSGTDWNLKS